MGSIEDPRRTRGRRLGPRAEGTALALAALAFLAPLAPATTVARLTRPGLVRAAAAIVWGRCESAESFVRPDGLIATRYTFAVTEFIKGGGREGGGTEAGGAARTYTLTQLGGTVGERTLWIPGSARFSPGEEVIIFVAGGGRAEAPAVTVGLAQGKFQIYWDAESRVRRVRRSLGALSVVPPPDAAGADPQPDSEPADARAATEHPALETFLAEIRVLVAADAKAKAEEKAEGGGR
ncbi:MAG: hypothetical protein JXP34_13130 [Planctomycetes bacterium]|nr:hypothetical protein [Planctomycetota bacterium]